MTDPSTATTRYLGPHPYAHAVAVGGQSIRVDEPASVGGTALGPDPFELLAAAVAACTAMTIQHYAHRKGWSIPEATVQVELHEESPQHRQRFSVKLGLARTLTDEQVTKLLHIATRCPTRLALAPAFDFDEHAESV